MIIHTHTCMNDVDAMKTRKRLQHLKNDVFHDVRLQRFVRCVFSERGDVWTHHAHQDAQLRTSPSLNFKGLVKTREICETVLLDDF